MSEITLVTARGQHYSAGLPEWVGEFGKRAKDENKRR
jgi:hypothetical protein